MNLKEKIATDPYYKKAAEILAERYKQTGIIPHGMEYIMLAEKLKREVEMGE